MPSSHKRKRQNLVDPVEKHKHTRKHDDKMLQAPPILGAKATDDSSGLASGNPISALELLQLIKNRETSQERKIDQAYAFVTSGTGVSNAVKDFVSSTFKNKLVSHYHFSVCLSEWIQGLIINSSKAHSPNLRGKENTFCNDLKQLSAHLDSRVWAVLKWCLVSDIPWNAGFVSLGIMQVLSHVLDEICIVISEDASHQNTIKEVNDDDGSYTRKWLTHDFLVIWHDVVQLLLCRHEGAFRPKLDLWVCFMASCLKTASTLCSLTNVQESNKIIFELLITAFRCFSNFLKSTPNPRKVFQHVVGKLIENLLSLHGNFRMSGVFDGKKKLLNCIEEILKYTLFHRSHLDGYKNVCRLSIQSEESSGDIRHFSKSKEDKTFLSYHKLLFQKIDQFVNEGNVSTLESTDWILRTYIEEAKTHMIPRSSTIIGAKNKHHSKGPGQDIESGSSNNQKKDPEKMDFFVIFAELFSPFLNQFKSLSIIFYMRNEIRVSDMMRLKAVTNAMTNLLLAAKEEHIYVPTEDTPALLNLHFMKDIYKSFIHFSMSIQNYFPDMMLGNTNDKCQDDIQFSLMEVINNTITCIGHILEIEYRAFENDLHGIWTATFSAAALQFHFVNMRSMDCSCATNSPITLASRIIAVFSELRQVEQSVFSLCDYLRHVMRQENTPSFQTRFLRHALESTLLSQHFLKTLSTIVREIPEGQVTSFMRLLMEDMEQTLKMVHLGGRSHKILQPSALKVLVDLYVCILDHGNITASNSMRIGLSLRTLMDKILIPYLGVLMDSVTTDGDKIINYARFSHDLEKDHDLENDIGCACITNERTTILLAWAFVLRIYMSVKCSHRQCVSLMPPKAARKASIAIDDPVLTLYTGDHTEMEESILKECFFSCTRKGSVSVLDIINGIHECVVATKKKVEQLQYTLHCIGIQSLADLKRQIRAVHYLLVEMDLKTFDDNDGKVQLLERRTFQKLHKKFKKKSKAIASFLTNWIKDIQILLNSPHAHTGQANISHIEELTWNKVVGNLNGQTLLVAKWAVLCQNIDVWLEFSDKDDLKSFAHVMLGIVMRSNNPIGNENAVNFFSITNELLMSDSFYEEKMFRETFLQEICQLLAYNLCMENFDICVKSAIHYIQSQVDVLDNHSSIKRHHAICFEGNVTYNAHRFVLPDMEKVNFTKCIRLINLVLSFPSGYLKTHSAAELAASILQIERFIVLSLLELKSGQCGSVHMHFLHCLELLVSCRRCLESLILRDDMNHSSQGDYCMISILLHESFSMYWFIISTDTVARCVHAVVHSFDDGTHRGLLLSLTRCTTGIFTFFSRNSFREYLKPLLVRIENGQTSVISASSMDLNLRTMLSTVAAESKCFSELYVNSESIFRSLIRQEFSRKEQNFKKEAPYVTFSFLYAMSSILWSITETIESFDEKCHLDKEGHTKWSDLFPDELLAFLCSTENFLDQCMHQFLLVNEEVIKQTQYNDAVSGNEPVMTDECHLGMSDFEDLVGHEQPSQDSKSDHGESSGEDSMDCCNELPNLYIHSMSGNIKHKAGSLPMDLPGMSNAQVQILCEIISGSSLEFSRLIGELFLSMAAILRLKSLFHSPNKVNQENGIFGQLESRTISIFGGFASNILREAAMMYPSHDCIQSTLISGAIKYLESVGVFLPYVKPTFSPAAVMNLINMQILLYGTLCSNIQEPVKKGEIHEELRMSLRNSFVMFLRRPLVPHFHLALQTIERALLGFEAVSTHVIIDKSCFIGLDQNLILAASIDYLFVVFESVIGPKRLKILSRYVSRYMAAIFNLIANDQILWFGLTAIISTPTIYASFYKENFRFSGLNTSTILKCIDILGTIASREVIFPMSTSHIAQSMNIPAVLFRPIYERNIKQLKLMQNFLTSNEKLDVKNSQLLSFQDGTILDLLVKVYTSCCKLLHNLLKHRRRESGHCIALLGDSLRALLFFLEIMDLFSSSTHESSGFVIECAIQCAGWLRRIYEEVAEHKETLGAYYTHLLSDYICVISGYGVTISGMSRKIEATLRPGAYALVDSCSMDDLQQLHAVLGEGPRRTALSELRRDYEQHYKYTGKV